MSRTVKLEKPSFPTHSLPLFAIFWTLQYVIRFWSYISEVSYL